MNLKFSVVAEREIQVAADYYETQQPGLGLRFIEELNRTTALILNFPHAWSPVSKRSRRLSLHRFPYSVIYSAQVDTVTIITVVHQRRDPEKWQTLIRDLER